MNVDAQLLRSAPEEQGIRSSAIVSFIDAVEQKLDALHSFMLLRHGQVAAEAWWSPYGAEYRHMLFSLSKSFTSTAVGLAVAEGRLSVDDRVLSFFPNDAPADVSANLAAMRVRHLLTMSTGHSTDTLGSLNRGMNENWAEAFLNQPVEHEPGTHFVYNSGATYMLSAIVQKLAGVPLLEYLQPRLFQPLGITRPTWETCPRGINTGGWGLSVKTEAIARFGQLYLQKGVWEGKRLLPERWIDEAASKHVSNGTGEESDWEQGYGYQFWRCRHGAYRGDGAFGQYCIVMPDQDAVIAMTSGLGNMQEPLDLVWDHLLPGMESTALPRSDASEELGRKLSNLSLPTPPGSPSSSTAKRVSGQNYTFEPNDQKLLSVSLDFAGENCLFTVRDEREEHRIECGLTWLKGSTAFAPPAPRPVAASGAWTDDDTYTMWLYFYETPFRATITCRFVDDRLAYDYKLNVGFGPTERPQLIGRAVSR